MGFQDKSLQCADCGTNFTFTAREQEFYAVKGFTNEPKRCQSCRQSRKRQGNNSGQRQMFAATCAQCGKETEVPFEPREGRPVYCSDCFNKVKTTRS
ncbi:MAG: zinc-binding protein [Crenarchaeota archaeon]|nr:zinc-binding protein [Thermoproteota archaeon]